VLSWSGQSKVKRAIPGLYRLKIEDPAGSARRVACLLVEDRFICPPDKYEVKLFNIAADYSDPRKTESNLEDRQLRLDS